MWLLKRWTFNSNCKFYFTYFILFDMILHSSNDWCNLKLDLTCIYPKSRREKQTPLTGWLHLPALSQRGLSSLAWEYRTCSKCGDLWRFPESDKAPVPSPHPKCFTGQLIEEEDFLEKFKAANRINSLDHFSHLSNFRVSNGSPLFFFFPFFLSEG